MNSLPAPYLETHAPTPVWAGLIALFVAFVAFAAVALLSETRSLNPAAAPAVTLNAAATPGT